VLLGKKLHLTSKQLPCLPDEWSQARYSCLSPAIFNMFVNAFIVNLRQSDIGCHILNRPMYYGCLLYADDIVLLSPSVNGLQLMLDIGLCLRTAADLSLQFNCSKSHCLVIGRAVDVKLQSLLLGDNHIH